MTSRQEIEADLRDTEVRMDRRRDFYLRLQLGGGVTRARTTTYNAEMDRLAERRAELRRMLSAEHREERP